MLQRLVFVFPLASLFLVLLAPEAHAYVDPVSGSIILQGIIAGLTAAIFVVKTKWRQITAWYENKKNPKEDTHEK